MSTTKAILQAIGVLKGSDPKVVAQIADDADAAAKALTAQSLSPSEEVKDRWQEGEMHTHATKEEIKVGYNLRRKIVLLTIWAGAPVALWIDPTMVGLFEPATGLEGFARHTGMLWLYIGIGGLLFRTVHLFFIKGVLDGLVWMTKILTDPFHDIYLYHKAPLALMRGELIEQRGTLGPVA